MLHQLDLNNLPSFDDVIIIPTFNRENLLRKTLSHSFSSISGNVSLLVLDNCSTDGTPDVVENFSLLNRDIDTYYYRHQCNIGAARNFRLAFSLGNKSKYFFVMADDDLIDSDFFETAFTLAKESDEPIFVYPRFILDPGSGQTISYEGDNLSYLEATPYKRLKRYVSLPSSNSIFYSVRQGLGKSRLKEPLGIGSDIYMTMHSLIKKRGICLDQYTMQRSLKNWASASEIRSSDTDAFQKICNYPDKFFQSTHYYAHKFFDMMSHLWLAMAALGASMGEASLLQSLYYQQISPSISMNTFKSLLLFSLAERRSTLTGPSETMKCCLAETYLGLLHD